MMFNSEIVHNVMRSFYSLAHFSFRLIFHSSLHSDVVGSIPDGVTGILHWLNPSGRPMPLGSTQPLSIN